MNYIKYYMGALKRLHAAATRHLAEIEKELKTMPEGNLHIKKRGHGYSCYNYEKGIQRSISSKDKKVERLGRKRFLERDATFFRTVCESLERLFAKVEDNRKDTATHTGLIDMFGEARMKYTREQLAWLTSVQTADNLRPEEKKYRTRSGIRVRSMSERYIADILYDFGILFIYEPELILGGETFVPDFVILRPDGEIIIWEHFGLTSIEEYRQRMEYKLAKYREYGFYQHTNLICTYEDDIEDKARIEAIVKERLCRI
ncbi:MAG: hypothetical protein MR991_03045 [Clostridiales bacterium]|nr:hypothetical protein [Clostridiales bacterium]